MIKALQQQLAQETHARQQAERKYQQLLKNLRHEYFFYHQDADNLTIHLSEAVQSALGYDPKTLLLKHSRFFGKNIAPKSLSILERTLFEVEVTCQNNLIKTLQIIEMPVFDKHQQLVAVEGTVKDITKLKHNEKNLLYQADTQYRHALTFLQHLINSLPNAVFIKENAEHFLGYNQAFVDTYLVSIDGTVVRDDSDIINNEHEKTLLKHKTILPYETCLTDVLGNEHEVLIQYSLFELNPNQPLLLGVITDISANKKIEKTLKQAKELAEFANRAKSEFLANMSHEIRTPLNTVMGFSDLLASKITDKEHQSYLNLIKISGNNLLTLINDILDLSKIEAGQLKIEYKMIQPVALLTELGDLFHLEIKKKNLQFDLTIGDELPPYLWLDEVRLRQVLFNLLGNAVKFTDKGKVQLSVTANAYDDEHVDMCIQVKDTGIGIAPHQQKMIFEPFQQQSGQNTRKYGGTGLGLTISKRLVEMMGGEIKVQSKLKQGSCFSIYLQRVKIAQPTQMTTKQSNQLTLNNIQFQSGRVLVVDDIKNNRMLIKNYLTAVNLTVHCANDGRAVLALVQQYDFDLILMDLRMPKMDGYQTTIRLKNQVNTRHIPVIALTASVNVDKPIHLKALKFDAYLPKPVNINDLLFLLSSYFSHTTLKTQNKMVVKGSISKILDKTALKQQWHQHLLPLWEETQIMLEIESIKKLTTSLTQCAKQYQVNTWLNYANHLFTATQQFDIDTIEQQLKQFPDLGNFLNEY